TLVISEFRETFAQGIEIGGVGLRGDCLQHTDAPGQLLRMRRERPRSRRAAQQRDERAPFHSITSVARSRNDSGIVNPKVFVVVRLRTRSNFVGCSTGRSAGFAPRRILST